MRVQTKYAYSFKPLDSFGARLKPLVNTRYRDEKGFLTALQTLASALLVAAVFRDGFRRRWSERSSLLGLYLGAFWLFPVMIGSGVALYRSEALLAPAALLVPGLPRWLQLGFLAAAVLLSIPMASLFFRGVLF